MAVGEDTNRGKNSFKNIPVGSNVRLVAYSLKKEKILTYSSNITIKVGQELTISLKETNEEDLKNLFN